MSVRQEFERNKGGILWESRLSHPPLTTNDVIFGEKVLTEIVHMYAWMIS